MSTRQARYQYGAMLVGLGVSVLCAELGVELRADPFGCARTPRRVPQLASKDTLLSGREPRLPIARRAAARRGAGRASRRCRSPSLSLPSVP